MPAWFRFKNTVSTDLGVIVTEYPPEIIPEERVEFKEIPGRSGALALPEGEAAYKDVILTVGCYAADLSRRDAIAAWLRGAGALILGSDPTRAYRARAANQIELKKIARGRSARAFDAIFRCQPFRYEAEPQTLYPTNGAVFGNPGTVFAQPLITVYGAGDITLTAGDVSVILTGVADAATLDCEAMVAYRAGVSETSVPVTLLNAKWPTLPVGEAQISWTGDVRQVTVTPNWRWL